MDPRRLRVLIADDHAILRSGLARLMEDVPDIAAVGEASSANEARQLLRSGTWDILLLDLDMPGQNPLEALRAVKMEHPEVAVLILSMYPEEQFGVRTLKAGASGYLTKDSATDELITAIRRIGEGGAYISARLTTTLVRFVETQAVDCGNRQLTDREFSVLRGIAAGRSITQISKELNISAKTVSTYRSRVLKRLNLHSNVELARYAEGLGLVK